MLESFNQVAGPQAFSCEICGIFKNTLFHRTSLVAASDSFRFPACNFNRKQTPPKMIFRDFWKIFANTSSFNRTAPDDCFLCLSMNFEKFFIIPILWSTSGKVLILGTSCRISTTRYSKKLFPRYHSKTFTYLEYLKTICKEVNL